MPRLKMPKNLTRDQAWAYHKAIEKQFPEIRKRAEVEGSAAFAMKPNRRTRDLQEAATRAYNQGFQDAEKDIEGKFKAREVDLDERRRNIRLDTVKTMRDVLSATGQTLQQMTDALRSEADQL